MARLRTRRRRRSAERGLEPLEQAGERVGLRPRHVRQEPGEPLAQRRLCRTQRPSGSPRGSQPARWTAAGIGALASLLVNNLPATVLLAAHPSPRPDALLLGLDLGPNLAITGSLSAALWLQAARAAGARPSIATYTRLGVVLVPLTLAATVALTSWF
jgi:hypothetical protein